MNKIVVNKQDIDYLLEMMKLLDGQKITVQVPFENKFDFIIEPEVRVIVTPTPEEAYTHLAVYDSDGFKMFEFKLGDAGEKYDFIYTNVLDTESKLFVHKLAEDIVRTMLMFFYLLNNRNDYALIKERTVIETKSQTNQKTKDKKKRNNKKRSNVVRVHHTIYEITKEEDVRIRTKRSASRNWHVDQFERRGHYRTLRSGQRVWVKPTTVKIRDGQETTDKTYKL